jgi:hypothetical protein
MQDDIQIAYAKDCLHAIPDTVEPLLRALFQLFLFTHTKSKNESPKTSQKIIWSDRAERVIEHHLDVKSPVVYHWILLDLPRIRCVLFIVIRI